MKKYIVTVFGLLLTPALAWACPVAIPQIPQAPPTYAIQIMKSGPVTITENSTITYTVVVRNVGQTAASPVTMIDTPPTGFVYVPGNHPECTASGGSVTCTLSSMPPSTEKVYRLTFQVPSGACPAGKTVINGARHTVPNNVSPGNSVATWLSECVVAATPTPTPKPEVKTGIEVVKTDNKTSIDPNGNLTYFIKVTNKSDVPLFDVKVTDDVPSEVIVTDTHGGQKDGNTVVWMVNLGEKDSGDATKEIKLTVKVKSNAKCNKDIVNNVKAENSDYGVNASAADSDTEVKCKVLAAVVAPRPIAPVAVTAPTGAGSLAMVVTLLGAAGLGVTRRLFS